MPKAVDKIDPFLMAVAFADGRGKQLVHTWKGLVEQRNEVVFEHDFELAVLVVLAAEGFEHEPNVAVGNKLRQLKPIGKTVVSDLERVCFVGFGFTDSVVTETMNQLSVNGANGQASTLERMGDRQMVTARTLHNNLSFTRQAFQRLGQSAEFAVGVSDFEGRNDDNAEGLHDGNHAFAF